MTDQQITIEIAKLDGWTVEQQVGYWTINSLGNYPSEHSAWQAIADRVKPYLTSRDAIIPVIEKVLGIDDNNWTNFFLHLGQLVIVKKAENLREQTRLIFCASAKELSIALLKAVGKWEE